MCNIDIVVIDGWELNPNNEEVNKIKEDLLKNNGRCISIQPNRIGHNQCPCCMYLEHNTCYCGLYTKK